MNYRKKKSEKGLNNVKVTKNGTCIKKPKRNYQRFRYTEESLRETIEKVRNKVLSANESFIAIQNTKRNYKENGATNNFIL